MTGGGEPPRLARKADAGSDPRVVAFFRWYSLAAAVVGVAAGLTVLAGWALDVTALRSVLPGLTAMTPNTAVGFVLIGIGLGVAGSADPSPRRRRAAAAAAALVAALGLLTMAEYVVGWDLHIDLLLFRHAVVALQTSPPGRMAPTTAIGFLALGIALICARAARYRAATLVSSLAALIGLNGVLGYLYGNASLYRTVAFPTMALNTAVTLSVTALGVVVLAPERLLATHTSASGVLMRRLLPISVIGLVGVGWLRLLGERAGLYPSEFGVSLMVAANLLILISLIVWTSGSLDRADRERMAADRALRVLNTELEDRVRQRTLELRSSEERFRSLAESAPVGTFRTDARGRCSYVNPAWSELTGLSPEEAAGEGWIRMIEPGDHDRVLSSWGQAAAAGDADVQRFRVRTPGGTVRWVDARAVALLDDGGGVEGFIRTICDITVQVEAEQAIAASRDQLEQANVQLARSNEELEQFAYIASHDLSEPLRAISGPISLLARRYHAQLDPEADQFIEFAVDGCRRMQAMIDDLLAFSRAGRVDGELQFVDCGLLVSNVIAGLGPRIAETGAAVIVEPLPTVASQPTQLGQVFQNLISNALKFVPPDVVPEVVVSAERAGDEWRFSVTDNGIGIEARHRERIFGMFKRLHSRDEYAGSGIGLALCKRIVEREGGRIGVEDAPSGRGTRFWVTLPVAGPTASGVASLLPLASRLTQEASEGRLEPGMIPRASRK